MAIPITEEDNIVESIEQFFARLVLTDPTTDIDVELSPAETVIQIVDNDSKPYCRVYRLYQSLKMYCILVGLVSLFFFNSGTYWI